MDIFSADSLTYTYEPPIPALLQIIGGTVFDWPLTPVPHYEHVLDFGLREEGQTVVLTNGGTEYLFAPSDHAPLFFSNMLFSDLGNGDTAMMLKTGAYGDAYEYAVWLMSDIPEHRAQYVLRELPPDAGDAAEGGKP